MSHQSSSFSSSSKNYSRISYSFSGDGSDELEAHLRNGGVPYVRHGQTIMVDLVNPEPQQARVVQKLIRESRTPVRQSHRLRG